VVRIVLDILYIVIFQILFTVVELLILFFFVASTMIWEVDVAHRCLFQTKPPVWMVRTPLLMTSMTTQA